MSVFWGDGKFDCGSVHTFSSFSGEQGSPFSHHPLLPAPKRLRVSKSRRDLAQDVAWVDLGFAFSDTVAEAIELLNSTEASGSS